MVFSRTTLLAIALVSGAGLAAQQTPPPAAPPATGLIVGQVVDGESGRPVAESIVTLMANTSQTVNPIAALAAAQKVITDSSGRFVYRDLAKGRYTITVMKPGYVNGNYGKVVPRGPGSQLELGEGERTTDVRILVWKHSAITGRVLDEAGEPVVGAEIRVRRVTNVSGRPGFGSGPLGTITTDDRGVYRVAGLDPGTYIVGVAATSTTIPAPMVEDYFRATGAARAEMQQALFAAAPSMSSPGSPANQIIGEHILQVEGRMPTPPQPRPGESPAVYTAVYYPQATAIANATSIAVKGGETRSGVDMVLRPLPTVRVSGRLEGPDGAAGISTLILMPASAGEPASTTYEATATTVSDASGAFTFLGVPSGQYVLFVMKWPSAGAPVSSQVTVVQGPGGSAARGVVSEGNPAEVKPSFWALQAIAVGDSNITNLSVAMRTGLRVSGKVVFDAGSQTPPPANRIYPILEPTASWLKPLPIGEAMLAADGSFSLPGVPAGRYLLTIPVPTGWHVKSAVSGGRELSDLPFDLKENVGDVVVTVSNRGARVSGSVRGRDGKPDAGAAVIVFPVDQRYWVDFSSYPRRIRDVRAGRDGTFALNDFPPGEYYVVATTQAAMDWSTSRFFERLSQVSTKITLSEAEQKSIDLQTAQVR